MTFWAGDNRKKPDRWGFDSSLVASEWQSFWNEATCVLPFWRGAGPPRNLVNGLECTEEGPTRMTWGKGSIGSHKEAIPFEDDAANWELGGALTTTDCFPRVTHGTVLIIDRKTDGTNRDTAHFNNDLTSGVGEVTAFMPWSDGVTYWEWGGNAGARTISASGLSSQNVIYWAFVAGPQGMAIYTDGVLRSSNSTAATRTQSTNLQKLNDGPGIKIDDLKEYYFVATLDAAWSSGQVADWYRDPFGPIRMVDADPVAGIDVLLPSPTDSLIPILKRRRR